MNKRREYYMVFIFICWDDVIELLVFFVFLNWKVEFIYKGDLDLY